MAQGIRMILSLALSVLLAACDQQGRPIQEFGLEKLSKGISSEADVRLAMGQPETVWEEESGERTLEYPKGPMGARTWIFEISKDGKLIDYRQALSEETFARIKPGMSKDNVRKLLGKPRTIVQFKLKNEEVWDWRYMDSTTTTRLFNVHFDIDTGKVTRTSSNDDGPNGG